MKSASPGIFPPPMFNPCIWLTPSFESIAASGETAPPPATVGTPPPEITLPPLITAGAMAICARGKVASVVPLPVLNPAVSDLEVNNEERNGHLWFIRYPEATGGEGLVVATTRPETMLGDVAVAVHPEDERYKKLVGRKLKLPLTERQIPVIADIHFNHTLALKAILIPWILHRLVVKLEIAREVETVVHPALVMLGAAVLVAFSYYVALPDAVDDAEGKQGWIKFGEPFFDAGFSEPIRRLVQPRVGTLVLFPSYMWHGTVPFRSDQTRTTIAFDVIPR